MPGWHDATQKLQDAGTIQMVGIVQEQHPDRTRLFMQWKQMGWPIMVDSLNLLGVEVVPITLLIDEQGIIRFRGKLESLDEFLALKTETSEIQPQPATRPDLKRLAALAETLEAKHSYADALVLWGGQPELNSAITTYRQTLETEPRNGPGHFRLGVAYRRRYDSDHRQPDDFQRAIEHWGIALEIDPNQYIWRRRIQQYGPRLDKPYPFYDWVETARQEIIARGETPVALPIEPRGAEIASPSKRFESDSAAPTSPDPDGRIRRDEKGFIQAELTLVPAKLAAGATGRVHAVFRPNAEIKAHWNNEVDDLMFWIESPAGWQVDNRHLSFPNPPQPVSSEERRLELEVRSPNNFEGSMMLRGYALYYVCEDVRGSCLYRRQDLQLKLDPRDQPNS